MWVHTHLPETFVKKKKEKDSLPFWLQNSPTRKMSHTKETGNFLPESPVG